jgi:hypothetical protein
MYYPRIYEPGWFSRCNDCLWAGWPGFDSGQEHEIFLYSTTFWEALKPTQSSIEWIPGDLSLRIKRPWREAEQSPPCSVKVKSDGAICLHGEMPIYLSTWKILPLFTPEFAFRDRVKPCKISIMIASHWVGIWTRDLSNPMQEWYPLVLIYHILFPCHFISHA